MIDAIFNGLMSVNYILNRPMISSIITWSGFGVTIGAILHILNPILGFIGACLWVGHGFYKFKKERNEFKQSEIKLKNLQDKAEKKHH